RATRRAHEDEARPRDLSPGSGFCLARRVGFEPTTNRLTADRSATELPPNARSAVYRRAVATPGRGAKRSLTEGPGVGYPPRRRGRPRSPSTTAARCEQLTLPRRHARLVTIAP